MQLHELIDKCITWIAYDGILGTEPLALHAYLRRFDESVDDAYFAYLYTILVEHPHVRVSITTEPLAGPDKTVRLGDAPLPDDFQVPEAVRNDVDISAMYVSGVKGRALAFHLSGQEYKSNAQVIEEKRVIQRQNALLHQSAALRKKREAELKQPKPDPEEGLIRDLAEDDGQGIPKADLNGLAQRWGSRLRLRCTDEETYARLTGSHRKNPKITPVVYHTLTLAVKSREKGITAVELGPLVGCSQGSMHHYMKVLTNLGLCTKVSTTIHAALTNLLVFHAFLEENPNYRVMKYGYNHQPEPEDEQVDESVIMGQDGDASATPGLATANDWGLQFPPLTETDMMNGLVIRERLTKLLDHPGLSNHLLRAKNLLPLLGWKSQTALRHRRAAPRMLREMLEEGQIEYVDVGVKAIRCIRLTKYNPDRVRRSTSTTVVPKVAVARLHDPQQLVERHSKALEVCDGCSMFQSIVYQIGEAINASDRIGMRIPDLRDAIFGLYRRMVEFHFSRMEKMTRPPRHLQHKSITTVMESEGRERRLRAFSITAHRANLAAAGHPIDNKDHPPTPPEAGHFAEVSHRAFFTDTKSFDKYMDKLGTPAQGSKIITKAEKPPPTLAKKSERNASISVPPASETAATPTPALARSPSPDPGAVDWTLRLPQREYKATIKHYDKETQVRGRPRKYVHVVRPDGKVDRGFLGQILPHPDLAAIYILLIDERKLVPAPDGYTGLGAPPPLTAEDISKALDPEFFMSYPRAKGSKTPLALRPQNSRAAPKEKIKPNPTKRKASVPPAVEADTETELEESGPARRSKRARKPMQAPEIQPEQEADELIYSEDEHIKTDEPAQMAEIIEIQDDVDPHLSEDVDMTAVPPDQIDVSTFSVDPALDTALSIGGSAASNRPGPDQAVGSKSRQTKAANVNNGVPTTPSYPAVLETPSHLRSVTPQQFYTPPGFDRFTILPPVVYVPPGHTVWPPLPPGYPTTDVPPPGWQASPVPTIAAPSIPSYWNREASSNTEATSPPQSRHAAGARTERSPVATSGPVLQPSAGSSVPSPSESVQSRSAVERHAHKPRQPSPLKTASGLDEGDAGPDLSTGNPDFDSAPTPSTAAVDGTPAQVDVPVPRPSHRGAPSAGDVATEVEDTQGIASALPLRSDLIPIRQVQIAKTGRMDLGPIRRANEMLTVLQKAGGVCEEHELWKRHALWSMEVAGTDVPHAPVKGYTMDRTVWKRLISSTKEDGRSDNTTSSVPTSTAQWVQNRIMWLTDCPQERVQSYMRSLANTTKKATAPRPVPSTKIDLIPYTEVKLPAMHPSSTVQYHLVTDIDAASRELSGEARRNELLKDVYALSQLLGRPTSKWARTANYHRAVREALYNPRSQKILNRDRGVFLAPMLSQDISVGAWYSTVLTYERDDRLMEWLKSPENQAVPLWDIPFDIRTTKEGRRQRARARIRNQVETLLGLGLLSTLSYCDGDEAYITVDLPDMPNTHLKLDSRDTVVEGVSTYVLHDYAPVYHIAGTSQDLLGYLPVRTGEEIDKFWNVYRIVCMEPDREKLPEVLDRSAVDSTNVAKVPDALPISDSVAGAMRQLVTWKNDLKLLPVQREALNDAVDWATATTNIDTPEKLRALAWEYALPEKAVQNFIDHRLSRAKAALDKKHQREREQAAAKSLRTANAQKAFFAKLQEQKASTRAKWENRVKSICDAIEVHFDLDLLEFVGRQSLTLMSKGSLTDELVERTIRLYIKTKYPPSIKSDVPPPVTTLRPIPIVRARLSAGSAPKRRPFRPPGTRVRRKWTEEDDELLLDAEAIIRARNRDIVNGRGRAAMEQLFNNVLAVTFLARIKKSTSTSSGQAYLSLLTNAWYDLWHKHRGTEALPDDDFTTNIHFDLQGHINFLREHIKKTELRVQASKMENQVVPARQENQLDLPEDVLDLVGRCRWTYRSTKHVSFDILWQTHNSQEHRLGQIGSLSLVKPELEAATMPSSLTQGRLRGLIKMIVATPSAQYDQTAAISLLRDYDQNRSVNPEIQRMVAEKVLVRHNSATMTGRFYSFSQAWQNLAQGTFTKEFYQDAARLEDKISAPDGIEWPVLGSSGELAALMNMVSEHTMDPSTFPTVLADNGLLNTRRLSMWRGLGSPGAQLMTLDDISFEFGFQASKARPQKVVAEPPSLFDAPIPRHWHTIPEGPAVDVEKVYDKLRSVGPDGLTKPDIQSLLGISVEQLHATLAAIPAALPQAVFWAGYDTARLVHIDFWPQWQSSARKLKLGDDGRVISGGDGEVTCTPRRWVDIWGRRIDSVWEQAVGCAVEKLLSRPGMTERIIRQKLCHVLDRLETNDVLQYLVDKGVASRVRLVGGGEQVPPIEAAGVEDEGDIVWRLKPENLLV